jgi:hypothetical protein
VVVAVRRRAIKAAQEAVVALVDTVNLLLKV